MNFYLIFHISRRSIRLILLLSYHILSYVFIYYTFHIPFYFLYFLSFSCTILCTFHILYSCTVLILFSYIYIHVLFISYISISRIFSHNRSYTVLYFYLHSYTFHIRFNLVLFMYCTFICLLLVSSLSSFISMTYYILCTITYIIYFPIPISSLFSYSGYTPMLCYSFLTYCFIIYFLIRTCIVIYFHFILYCLIVFPYIFILYFSYTIISYDFHILCFAYTVLSYYLSYTFLCH